MDPGPNAWEVATTFATWTLAAGALLGVLSQNRLNRRTLEAGVFTRLNQQWDSPEMRRRRGRLATYLLNRKGGEMPPVGMVKDVVDFYEDLGTMLRRKQISVDAIWHSFGDPIIYYWEIIGQDFKRIEEKKQTGTAYYAEFESLVRRMREEDARRKLPAMVVTPEDRSDFLGGEAELAAEGDQGTT